MDFELPEGATPLHDYSGLKVKWVQTQNDLDRAEAENIAAARSKHFKRVPSAREWFHPRYLISLHQDMFGNVWDWAGKYRREITSIGIKPQFIPYQLASLCEEVLYWSNNPVELTFLERAAMIHHKLVSIHPFENGNGRFSRMVADRYLIAWKCSHPQWPVDLQKNGEMRSSYIKALKSADAGDYQDLLAFMIGLGAEDIKPENLAKLLKHELSQSQLESMEIAFSRFYNF